VHGAAGPNRAEPFPGSDFLVENEAARAPIGRGASAARKLLRIVDGFFFYFVGFIAVCTLPEDQRLGDEVAGTLVIARRARAWR
jgi:hypothetical protein